MVVDSDFAISPLLSSMRKMSSRKARQRGNELREGGREEEEEEKGGEEGEGDEGAWKDEDEDEGEREEEEEISF